MQSATLSLQDVLRSVQAHDHAATSIGQQYLGHHRMAEVPVSFNRVAHTEFALLSEADDTLDWEDYCPAYAMGLLTFDACFREVTRVSDVELHALWDAIRGVSRLSWKQAQAVVARSWNMLAWLEHEGQI